MPRRLPEGLPSGWFGGAAHTFPAKGPGGDAPRGLPALLAPVLLAFTLEFEGDAPVPLELSATTLRVLDARGVRLADLPRLTGCSPEMSDIGWRLEQTALVVVEPDPGAPRG